MREQRQESSLGRRPRTEAATFPSGRLADNPRSCGSRDTVGRPFSAAGRRTISDPYATLVLRGAAAFAWRAPSALGPLRRRRVGEATPRKAGRSLHLSRVTVQGLRASADQPLVVDLPGRFCGLVGANGGGKTTVAEAVYLAHTRHFPALAPPSAAALGTGTRIVDIEYRFDPDPAQEGPSAGRSPHRPAGALQVP